MIDAHCHLNFQTFENDFDEVINNASAAGVHTIINAGTQISSSQWAVELAEKYPNLYAVVAVHPHHADKVTKGHPEAKPKDLSRMRAISETSSEILHSVQNDNIDWLEQLEQIAGHPKVVGIGECGMDFFNYQSNGIVDRDVQKKVFIRQLELAHKLKLPLQVHSRNDEARKEIITILKDHKDLLLDIPGMFHCMAGSKESLKAVLDLGFYVGFDGNSMYEGNPPDEPVNLKELIQYTPVDRIMVESDSPYLTPLPYRGRRNEPQYVIITAKFIAGLKQITLENFVEQTDKNVYTVFTRINSNIEYRNSKEFSK